MSGRSLKLWPTFGFRSDEGDFENGTDLSANCAEGQQASCRSSGATPFGISAARILGAIMGCSGLADRQANNGV